MQKKYIIGIDLHGTLLDDHWQVRPQVRDRMVTALTKLNDFCAVYVCSGNDLTFIPEFVPDEVRALFEGYVLETGCVVSDGEQETVIVPDTQIAEIKMLEAALKKDTPRQVKYFARRLATISLFTRDEHGGPDPLDIFDEVCQKVAELGCADKVLVTHSNVAVDIIPVGFNKFTGISHVAAGRKTIGIADSLNDLHLVLDSDRSFLPVNASSKLLEVLVQKGYSVEALTNGTDARIMQSSLPSTDAVIETLEYIEQKLR